MIALGRTRMLLLAACSVVGLLQPSVGNPPSALGQEVQWRHDYAAGNRFASCSRRARILVMVKHRSGERLCAMQIQ